MTPLLVIVGPTASGKSALAMTVAERLGGRILSIDSMQVYRGMDIGTAKPSPADQTRVPHSMIDLVEPDEEFTVDRFQREARDEIERAEEPVLVVGGSGLHLRAVIDPLEFLPTDADLRGQLEASQPDAVRVELLAADPDAGDHVDLANHRRVVRAVEVIRLTGRTPTALAAEPSRRAVAAYEPRYPVRIFGVDPGDGLEALVDRRLEGMVQAGLVEEVTRLAPRLGRTAAQAVGYKELLGVVRGECGLEEGLARVRAATLELARRQRTWFRRDPRVRWLDPLQADPVSTVMAAA